MRDNIEKAEKFFVSVLTGLTMTVNKEGSLIFKNTEGIVLIYFRSLSASSLFVNLEYVWSHLENNNLHFVQVQQVISNTLLQHLKWKLPFNCIVGYRSNDYINTVLQHL
jgi:hypothetical protein